MIDNNYVPDNLAIPTDAMILAGSGPEPVFDPVMRDFLKASYFELKNRSARGGLLEFASLGRKHPWLFRLTFRTRGFLRVADKITTTEWHVVALRFPQDYLKHADQFAMLRLLEPGRSAFHPNISPEGAICIEIYPGESLVEICQSLHSLFCWRLRQYDERDALNPAACEWGRDNINEAIDDRPLFGQHLNLQWQTTPTE